MQSQGKPSLLSALAPDLEVSGTVDLRVEIGASSKSPLVLRNPVLVASGTFGYGTEYARLIDVQRLGAIVSKGITARPRRGNRGPRIVETPSGMLNAIGLQNIGIHKTIAKMAPLWAEWDVPVVVNIAGDTVDEFAYMAERLEGVTGVAGIELNISCPNVWEGGRVIGEDAATTSAIVEAVRARTGLPVLVKLSPQVADICGVARAAEDAGADAISLINTFVGMKIDTRSARPSPGEHNWRAFGTGDQAARCLARLSCEPVGPRSGHRHGRHRECRRCRRVHHGRRQRDPGRNRDIRRTRNSPSHRGASAGCAPQTWMYAPGGPGGPSASLGSF